MDSFLRVLTCCMCIAPYIFSTRPNLLLFISGLCSLSRNNVFATGGWTAFCITVLRFSCAGLCPIHFTEGRQVLPHFHLPAYFGGATLSHEFHMLLQMCIAFGASLSRFPIFLVPDSVRRYCDVARLNPLSLPLATMSSPCAGQPANL